MIANLLWAWQDFLKFLSKFNFWRYGLAFEQLLLALLSILFDLATAIDSNISTQNNMFFEMTIYIYNDKIW